MKEHEKTFDENNLRDFIDSFLLEKKKNTDPSFTVMLEHLRFILNFLLTLHKIFQLVYKLWSHFGVCLTSFHFAMRSF